MEEFCVYLAIQHGLGFRKTIPGVPKRTDELSSSVCKRLCDDSGMMTTTLQATIWHNFNASR